MGVTFSHRCDNCGYSVSTSGPWEFYRDNNGNLKPFGHPGPMSEEAEQRGLYGLYAELYCANCDKAFSIVLIECEKPSNPALPPNESIPALKDEFKRTPAPKCPKCGNTHLLFTPARREVTCPRCKRGKLVGKLESLS